MFTFLKFLTGTQLSQSSYFALQSPYIVFGLGKSPNFVEKITVGVGRSDDSKVCRNYKVVLIIIFSNFLRSKIFLSLQNALQGTEIRSWLFQTSFF